MRDEWRDQTPTAESSEESGGGPTLSTWITAAIVLVGFVIGFVIARDAMTSAVLFIAIMLGVVMVHEAGHFLTAKAFGIRVHEFAFGFPPRIFAKRIGETEYAVNWLPLGGYVRLEGEEDASSPRSLAARPRWQRLIVLTSGALVNLMLPVVLLSAALMIPHEEDEGHARITAVAADTPAAAAGLREGDVILRVGSHDAKNLATASRLVRTYQGRTVDLTVRRDGQLVTIPVYARWTPPAGQGPTGISIAPESVNPIDNRPYTVTVSEPPWEAIPDGTVMTWQTLVLARNEVIGWVKGTTRPQFQGPVGIAQTTGEVARSSETTAGAISPLLELAALLSINLGILNLLPLPMLDGGRVLFVVIEIVRGGRRIRPEREAIVHMIGMAAFLVLAAVVTFADISRIVDGG
ncbi:MAG: RIP metalloprotease [Dehalococcoidia bacterium]|nr:MAG: RIP metalloprotease [Dehalococcoidia bacterium]